MKKIYLYVQESCERRLLDAKRISNYLEKNNYRLVNTPKNADIIFFITCGFLNKVTEDSLNNVKKFQQFDAELIVAGCIPEIVPEELNKIFNGRKISTKNLEQIDKIFPAIKTKFCNIPDENIKFKNFGEKNTLSVFDQRLGKLKFYMKVKSFLLKYIYGENSNLYRYYTRKDLLYHIRICEGCMNKCSYCVIKKAVGPFKSKSTKEVIKEFQKGLANDYKYFVLTGDDTGAYGLDINSTFPKLLKELNSFPGEYELIIRSLNPQWVVRYIDELEEIFKTGRIESADIPVQSNSRRILKLMNRYADTKKVKDALCRLRKASPNTKLNTCYILGFPTETDEEFRNTLKLIDEINFSGHIFPFSCKKDSKIENLSPQITPEEIDKRIKFAANFLNKKGYKISFLKNTQAYLFDRD